MSKNKKSILLLGKLPPPYYGPAIATEIILSSSLKRKYNLIHLDTRLNKSTSSFGKFSLSKGGRSLLIYSQYLQILNKREIDLIIIPISQSTVGLLKDLPFVLLAKLFNTKTLVQLRGSNLLKWYKGSNKIIKKIFANLFKSLDGAVVLGESLRYLFRPFLADDKIFVVPNGADYNMPVKQESDKVRIFFLSILQKNKAPDILLESLIYLPKKILKKLSIKIAGEWESSEFENHCKEIVEQHSLPVRFLKPVSGDKKFSLLKNSEIFVFTPRAPEGHPWVIVEAMAAGLPIISTDQGAITESVLHNENGFIIPNENPKYLAEKLEILVENLSLRNKMAQKSREIYESNFTENKMIEKLIEAIDKTLK